MKAIDSLKIVNSTQQTVVDPSTFVVKIRAKVILEFMSDVEYNREPMIELLEEVRTADAAQLKQKIIEKISKMLIDTNIS